MEATDTLLLIFLDSAHFTEDCVLLRLELHFLSVLLSLGKVLIDALVEGVVFNVLLTKLLLKQEGGDEVLDGFTLEFLDDIRVKSAEHLLVFG